MTATWTATPKQLEAVIRPVLPHASSDSHMPMLCCISLEVASGRLLAAATNRYTMAIAWSELADWDPDADKKQTAYARIFATDLQRLLAFVKGGSADKATWTLTEQSLSVVSGNGEQLSIRTVDVEFVNWRKFLGERVAKEPATIPALAYNPAMADLFSKSHKAVGNNEPIVWRLGSVGFDAPIVQIGERFIGLLMPVRLPEQTALDLTPLGIDEPKAVAA
jgi:hypothetical protein